MAANEQDPVASPAEEELDSPGHLTRFLILAVVVVLSVGYMIYAAFPGNALYFLSVSEFMDQAEVQDGRMVRVSGQLVDGSFRRVENSTRSYFQLTDKDTGPMNQQLTASYLGILPGLFFNPHSEIILEGSYRPDQVFQTDTILVKCPSQYRSLEEESQDSI